MANLLSPGSILMNTYKILDTIGQGGMGAVYRAESRLLHGEEYAVKEMLDNFSSPQEKQEGLALFRQEANILQKLRHPNLPRVHAFFEENNRYYLVMDFIRGRTLESIAETTTDFLPESIVMRWAGELCSILDYLHNRQPPIIFRDLNPRNIMLEETAGAIKLIDFGIARVFKAGQSSDTLSLGSPGYCPIEQYGRGQTDARSDIYTLGATLYHLLTKKVPVAAIERIKPTPSLLIPPRKINRRISPRMEQVILQALEINPDHRFPSVAKMKDALFSPDTVRITGQTTARTGATTGAAGGPPTQTGTQTRTQTASAPQTASKTPTQKPASQPTPPKKSRSGRFKWLIILGISILSAQWVQGWQDRDSGTDASPNGATSLSIPGVAFDRVSYMRGDRTDWWELNVVQPCTLSVMVTSANATDGLRLTLFDRRGRTALQKVENRGSYLIATLPVNRPTVFFAQVMASRLWDSSIYTIRAVAGGDSLYIASLAEGRTDSGMIAATGQNIARPDSAPELRFNAITNGHVFVDNGKGMTWWRLTSERTGTVSISVYGRDGQPSPAIAVFDAKQQPLEALNARETEPVVAVMGAEAYFVRLSTENRNAPLPYELTATFMEDPEVFSGADREPGGARILPLQGAVEDTVSSVTGDRTDWWKVTFPANGLIGVDMTGQDLHGVRAALYEEKTVRNRRQTEFSGAIQETNGNGRLEVSGKSGDVYYLSVLADAGASPSPYSLQARFMIDPDANSGPDAEPSGAKTLPVDGGSRGAVDYDHGDRTDWWRLTTPGPGRMVITLIVRDPSARLSMELYDQQGASNVSRSVSAGNGREEVDIEAAGRETYLVKVFADKEGDASAYQLMTWYTMAPDASSGKDATPAGASALIIGTPSKGDVDYDGGDRTDWWKIRVPGRGNMTVDLNGENFSADLDIAVYDAPDAGEALATSHTRNSSKERVAIEVDRAGWYYIEVTAQKSGDKSRYTLKASFEP